MHRPRHASGQQSSILRLAAFFGDERVSPRWAVAQWYSLDVASSCPAATLLSEEFSGGPLDLSPRLRARRAFAAVVSVPHCHLVDHICVQKKQPTGAVNHREGVGRNPTRILREFTGNMK